MLPPEYVNALYQNFMVFNGLPCPEAESPTVDQLMVFEAVRTSYPDGEQHPWHVEFAIFGPWGRHTADVRKQILTFWCPHEGGRRQKALAGPGSLEEWKRSWAVFRAVSLMAGAASPGALDANSKGISEAMADFGRHPQAWGDSVHS